MSKKPQIKKHQVLVNLPSMANRFGPVDLEGRFSGHAEAPSNQGSDLNSFILSDRGRDNKTIYEQIKRWRRKHRQEKAPPTKSKKASTKELKPKTSMNKDLVFEAALPRRLSCKEGTAARFESMDCLSKLTILSERVEAEATRSPGELHWIDSEARRAAEEEEEELEASDAEDEVLEIAVDANWRERLEEAMNESLELQSRLKSQIRAIQVVRKEAKETVEITRLAVRGITQVYRENSDKIGEKARQLLAELAKKHPSLARAQRRALRPLPVPLKELPKDSESGRTPTKGKSNGVSLITSRLVSPQKDFKKAAYSPAGLKATLPKPKGAQYGERLKTLGSAEADFVAYRTMDRPDRNRLRHHFTSSRALAPTPVAVKPKLVLPKPTTTKKKSKVEFKKLYRKHLQELALKVQQAKAAAVRAERQQRKAVAKRKAWPSGVRTSCPSLVGICKDIDAVSAEISNAPSQRSLKEELADAEESFQTDLLASHRKEVKATPPKCRLPAPVVAARASAPQNVATQTQRQTRNAAIGPPRPGTFGIISYANRVNPLPSFIAKRVEARQEIPDIKTKTLSRHRATRSQRLLPLNFQPQLPAPELLGAPVQAPTFPVKQHVLRTAHR